jgi:hypothetical protein
MLVQELGSGTAFIFAYYIHAQHFVKAATSRPTNYVSRREIHRICFSEIFFFLLLFGNSQIESKQHVFILYFHPVTFFVKELMELVVVLL